jgi:hypothetical protein
MHLKFRLQPPSSSDGQAFFAGIVTFVSFELTKLLKQKLVASAERGLAVSLVQFC